MNNYDDAMFKYLTEPKNYKYANDLSSLLVIVNDKLKQEFWENVSKKLAEKLNSLDVYVEHKGNGNLTIAKSNWDGVAVGLDSEMDLGLQLNKSKYYDVDVLGIEEKYKEIIPRIHQENQNWLCYNQIENANLYKFRRFEDLFQILPGNREKIINQITDCLYDFTQKVIVICEEINELKRK